MKNKPQNLESFGKNRTFPPPTEAPGLWLPPLRKELKRTKSSRNYREGLHESKSEVTETLHETTSELAERVARELLDGLRRAAWVR